MPPLHARFLRALGYSAVGWVVLAVLRTSLRVAVIPRAPGAAAAVLGQVLLASLPWLFAAPAVVVVASRLTWQRGTRWRTAAVHLALLLALSVVEASWGWLVLPLAGYPLTVPPAVFYLIRLDQVLFLYLCLVGIGLAIRHQRRLEEAAARTAWLESRILHARLHALELQLHPHFLFNTLNAASELVHRDPAAARSMLASLRELLARSLDDGSAQQISLREELALLERYAGIQRTRFAGSLTIAVDADAAALDARVPRLVLQPLVENAIRHGTARRAGPGRVQVRARMSGARLLLEVEDDGPGLTGPPRREGVGLGNTRARLRQLYGDDARVSLEPGDGKGAMARIECPLVTGPRPGAEALAAPPIEPADDAGAPLARPALAIAGAWLLAALVGAYQDLTAAWLMGAPEGLAAVLPARLLEAALWLALTVPVVRIAARLAASGLGWPRLLAAHAGIGVVTISVHLALVRLLGAEAMEGNLAAAMLVNDLCVYAALATGAHAWTVLRTAAERRAAAARLDGDLAAARLDLLRWRLKPELLFGALDRIGALAAVDADRADELTGQLGGLLRLMLQDNDSETVRLSRELELVAAYLEVEGAVRAERSDLQASLDASVGDAPVPAMLLQPLVEAVGGLAVTIAARRAPGAVEIEIRAIGAAADVAAIEAVRRRLEARYGDARVLTQRRVGDECRIVLRLPGPVPEPVRAVA